MKRAKAERWEETHRQPIGFQVGHGRGKTTPWFVVLYRVTETQRKGGAAPTYRERYAYGKTLSVATMSAPELSLGTLLAIVAEGADTLSRYATAEDEKATPRFKRR